MKAYWLGAQECIDLSLKDLSSNGIFYLHQPVDRHRDVLDALKSDRGYVAEDVVELNAETPDLEKLLYKFSAEHLHSDEEVRYVLEGSGVFDIRSNDDCWMRIAVSPGDLIIVPAGRYHRFTLTEERCIKAIRLFKDQAGWVPEYRSR